MLGVDPGSLNTGWGLLSGGIHRPRLEACGVVRLAGSTPLPERLHRLHTELEAVIGRLRPDAAAVEAPFHGVNVRSSLALAHARGVVLEVLAGSGVRVHEYAPAEVKKAVTGNGRAEKIQVQRMIRSLLGADAAGLGTDVADALAAALCHLAAGTYGAAVEGAERAERERRGGKARRRPGGA